MPAEAMSPTESARGQGGGAFAADLSRSDMLLIRRAVRKGWSLVAAKRAEIIDRLMEKLNAPKSSARDVAAVAKALIGAHGQDRNVLLKAAQLEAGQPPPPLALNQTNVFLGGLPQDVLRELRDLQRRIAAGDPAGGAGA